MATATAKRKPVIDQIGDDTDFLDWPAQKIVQLLQEIDEDTAAIKARVSDEEDPPSEEECGQLEKEHGLNEAIKAAAEERLESLKSRVTAFKARIPDRPQRTIQRPNLGGQSAPGTGSLPAEPSGRIDLVASEEDKLIANPPFKSAGHFFKAVHLEGVRKLEPWAAEGLDKWGTAVKAAMTTWDDPSAGILVPEGYTNEIEKRMLVQQNLTTLCRTTSISGSSMTFFRRQDASRANGSRHAGVSVSYEGEGDTLAGTRPKYEKYRIEAHKLAALVEITEELLNDSPYAIEQEVNDLVAEAMVFTTSDKMVNGNGSSVPLGVMAGTPTATTGCRVVVSKETGQAAATLDHRNITKMWMRLDPESRADAIWMINNDISDELDNMSFPVGTGGVPSYLPAGGLSQTGYASLKGRPVIPFEYCQTLGTEGDIILANWKNGYRGVTKGGIKSAMSTHIYFERDSNCFRFTYRFGGQPRWSTPFTPKNGSTTTACFVTLQTRS